MISLKLKSQFFSPFNNEIKKEKHYLSMNKLKNLRIFSKILNFYKNIKDKFKTKIKYIINIRFFQLVP